MNRAVENLEHLYFGSATFYGDLERFKTIHRSHVPLSTHDIDIQTGKAYRKVEGVFRYRREDPTERVQSFQLSMVCKNDREEMFTKLLFELRPRAIKAPTGPMTNDRETVQWKHYVDDHEPKMGAQLIENVVRAVAGGYLQLIRLDYNPNGSAFDIFNWLLCLAFVPLNFVYNLDEGIQYATYAILDRSRCLVQWSES